MKSIRSIILSLCLVVALGIFPSGSWALSNVGTDTKEHKFSEDEAFKLMADAQKLLDIAPDISPDHAMGIAALLENLRNDEETQAIVKSLKEDLAGHDAALKNYLDEATPKELVVGLSQMWDELQAVEILFKDPVKAVEEMHAEGMIDEERLKTYRENPVQLEMDVRSAFHFSFVSFASAGGFLWSIYR